MDEPLVVIVSDNDADKPFGRTSDLLNERQKIGFDLREMHRLSLSIADFSRQPRRGVMQNSEGHTCGV